MAIPGQGLMALCLRQQRNELVAAECRYLLDGGRPDGRGLARCRRVEPVRQAAYLRLGIEVLAYAVNFERLLQRVAPLALDAEGFRIEYDGPAGPRARLKMIVAAADAIPSYPDLERPRQRFLLAESERGFFFGRIRAEADRSYRRHDERPYRISNGLPSRLARALVNLVAPARRLLDPCCGSGAVLLEASAVGMTALGADWNPKMVGMTMHNLDHFGYAGRVEKADARDLDLKADAVVSDLSYGESLEAPEAVQRQILARGARLAPVGVWVATRDLSDWIKEAGYRRVEVWRVPKQAGFVRYVHRGLVEAPDLGL